MDGDCMELIVPNKKYYKSYMSAINEYKCYNVKSYEFRNETQDVLFEQFENDRIGKNLPKGYVNATYLWLVDGEEFVGEISIRHRLTDALTRFGGHIGYGIRYSQWNKGRGTEMLSKALLYAKDVIGLDRVLLTCGDDNLGSARVIEKNGGMLQDKIINIINDKERLTRRYWIIIE